MVRRYRANGVDYLAHADQHAAGGLDPVAGGGGGGGGYATVQDEGVTLTTRTVLNFTGAGVTAADNAGTGATDVTIPGGGGTPSGTVVSETAFGQAAAAGAATAYSRGDHTHGTPAAPTVPAAASTVVAETGYGQATAVGIASTYSREDHSHGSPSLGSTATTAAAGNHTHAAQPAYATVQEEGVSLTQRGILNFVGTTITAADDAANTRTTLTAPDYGLVADVVTQAYSDVAAAGTSARVARADHRHGMPAAGGGGGPAFATNALVLGSAAAAGVAVTVLRSDDTIAAFDATAPSTLAFGGAAAVGTAAKAARRDHVHGMPLSDFELLGSTVLGANANSTATVVLSAIRDEIWIVYRVVGYSAGDIATFRFGNGTIDTGNNYYTRYITVAAGGVSLTNVATNSTNGLRVAGNSQTTGRSGLMIISNRLANEKIASVMDFCGTGVAATSPVLNLCGGGAWVNGSVQFDRLLMLAIGGQSLLAGSGFTVYGKNM
jgi:hypothetical protein